MSRPMLNRQTEWHVSVPVWALEMVLSPAPPLCRTCTGGAPSWDGHDVNPPCVGHARGVLRALASDGDRTLR